MDNVYEFIAQASDGTKIGTFAYTVTVSDVNERPFIHKDTVPDYMEIEYECADLRPIVHDFDATDYEGDVVTWAVGGVDRASFQVDIDSGILSFETANGCSIADFENPRDMDSDNVYEIALRATDDPSFGEDILTGTYNINIRVTDVNEQPEFLGTPKTDISWDENVLASTELDDYDARDEEGPVTFAITGTDRGDFDLASDGVLTFKQTPNFEDPQDSDGDNVYNFNIVATDTLSGSTRRSATQAVTVTVKDLEEPASSR